MLQANKAPRRTVEEAALQVEGGSGYGAEDGAMEPTEAALCEAEATAREDAKAAFQAAEAAAAAAAQVIYLYKGLITSVCWTHSLQQQEGSLLTIITVAFDHTCMYVHGQFFAILIVLHLLALARTMAPIKCRHNYRILRRRSDIAMYIILAYIKTTQDSHT